MSAVAVLTVAVQLAALAREVMAAQSEFLDVIAKARAEGRDPSDAELATLRTNTAAATCPARTPPTGRSRPARSCAAGAASSISVSAACA